MMLNGQFDSARLTPVSGSLLLRHGPAAAWSAVCREAQRRYGWTPTLNDAYRDLAHQVAMLEANYDHTWRAGMTEANGGLRVWGGSNWYRKPGKATAAEPGTSNHGWGIAVDVDNLGAAHSTRWTQFATVAQPLGWSWSASLGEPWHWDFTGPADTVSNVVSQILTTVLTAPDPLTIAPPEPREITMLVIKGADRADCYITDGMTKRHLILDGGEFGDWLKICGQTEPDVKGQWTVDRIPDWTPNGAVDTAAIAAAVVAALPKTGTGATADEVEAAVKTALSGLTLKAQA